MPARVHDGRDHEHRQQWPEQPDLRRQELEEISLAKRSAAGAGLVRYVLERDPPVPRVPEDYRRRKRQRDRERQPRPGALQFAAAMGIQDEKAEQSYEPQEHRIFREEADPHEGADDRPGPLRSLKIAIAAKNVAAAQQKKNGGSIVIRMLRPRTLARCGSGGPRPVQSAPT
jgi:hypothetical protein